MGRVPNIEASRGVLPKHTKSTPKGLGAVSAGEESLAMAAIVTADSTRFGRCTVAAIAPRRTKNGTDVDPNLSGTRFREGEVGETNWVRSAVHTPAILGSLVQDARITSSLLYLKGLGNGDLSVGEEKSTTQLIRDNTNLFAFPQEMYIH